MNKHPHTSGLAALPLIIILALLLIGGGVYMYRNTAAVQPVATTTPSEQAPVPRQQSPAPIQNVKGEIFSLSITPSTKDQVWTTYRSGAKAIVKGKNLKSVVVNFYSTGTGIKDFSTAGTMSKVSESLQEQVWELVLPNSFLTTRFWAEAKDLAGQSIKSTDLGNVGYEEAGPSTTVPEEQLIDITSPKPNSRVDATRPVIITGKARKVFALGGEFPVDAYYISNSAHYGIASTVALCNKAEKGCDDLEDNFVNFTAQLDLSRSPSCSVNVDFYIYNRTARTKAFYTLPLSLYGNGSCK